MPSNFGTNIHVLHVDRVGVCVCGGGGFTNFYILGVVFENHAFLITVHAVKSIAFQTSFKNLRQKDFNFYGR